MGRLAPESCERAKVWERWKGWGTWWRRPTSIPKPIVTSAAIKRRPLGSSFPEDRSFAALLVPLFLLQPDKDHSNCFCFLTCQTNICVSREAVNGVPKVALGECALTPIVSNFWMICADMLLMSGRTHRKYLLKLPWVRNEWTTEQKVNRQTS